MSARWFWLAATLVIALGVLCQWTIGFNNDNAWLLYTASRVVDGARLYVDVVEINPPLIIWLEIPIVWLARSSGLAPVEVFRAVVLGGALASATACNWIAGRAFPSMRSSQAFFLVALALIALPVSWFGQREHLLLILVLPYLFLSAGRTAGVDFGAGFGAGVGVLAGLGFALKPHFCGIWLLVAGAGLLGGRGRAGRSENTAILLVGAAYLTGVILMVPEYLDLVRRLGAVYGAYRREGAFAILFGRFESLAAFLALAVHLVYRRKIIDRDPSGVLALGVVGSLLGLVLQGKGFDYHYYPALGLAVILTGTHALRPSSISRATVRRLRAIALVLLAILSVPYLVADVRIGLDPAHGELRAYHALERAVGATRGQSLLVLAPRSGFAFGLVTYGGLRWVGRFPCLWVPPTLYRAARSPREVTAFRDESDMAPVERWFRSTVISDAIMGRPDVILVGIPTPGAGPTDYGFDLLRYLSEDQAFAEFMRGYRREGEAVGYVIYRRRTAGA